jgi:hypothetical protein
MSAAIHFDELSPEQRKRLGVRAPRKSTFTQEDVRSWASKILAAMAGLSRQERERVLKHAHKIKQFWTNTLPRTFAQPQQVRPGRSRSFSACRSSRRR